MRTLLFSCLLFNSFFAIFFSISNLVLVSGHCQSDQRQLLLELNLSSSFRSTTFATPLGRLMKWNQTKDCCSWEGISCDAGGHVIGLDLSIRGISCPLDVSSSLFRFQHLQRLNLAFNWFKTSFLTGFDKLENLSYLNLSYSDFKRQIPVEISRLTRLVTLDLSAFPISKTSLKLEKPNLEMLVQNLTRLRFLYLDGITISATGNELCRAVLPFTKLQVLSMSDCYLSGPIPSCSSFKNLGELNLGDNQLSGTIHSTDWSGLSKLEIVDLSNSKRSGTIPPTLFGIQSLRRLFLSQNQFNGSIGDLHGKASSLLGTLHYMANFQLQLKLPKPVKQPDPSRNTQLDLEINKSLNINSGIWILDLHGNQLQGQVPTLPSYATYLDYSDNNFSFVLPAHIGDSLQFTSFFSLSNNNIQGRIPESLCNHTKLQVQSHHFFGKLQRLESLDLSRNSLGGEIPLQLANLNFLLFLNVSNNKLVGPIPTSTQLQTFSEASFENNAGLCGPPLKTMCGLPPAKEDSPSDSETGSIIAGII
ncbi:receptor-like protein Cf-9 homolog [Gossypium hirsutum]|uniref:Receptor-like protein Cf-9 homolog n=1 Tax=Gossypium hirsutum TaxID=3635 RepID=A0ABM3AF31_GOSHI|nr:receptor-like protein Cf-9 homolog [Gossypium hirsutum]